MKTKLWIVILIIELTMVGVCVRIIMTDWIDHYKTDIANATIVGGHYEHSSYPPRDDWILTIKYKNSCLDAYVDNDVYNMFDIGDSCEVELAKAYNKDNKLIWTFVETISRIEER